MISKLNEVNLLSKCPLAYYVSFDYTFPAFLLKAPRWRNRQTRRTQNPVMVTSCGFDPHPRHQIL